MLPLVLLAMTVTVSRADQNFKFDDSLINNYGPVQNIPTQQYHNYRSANSLSPNLYQGYGIDKKTIDEVFQTPYYTNNGQDNNKAAVQPIVTSTVANTAFGSSQDCQCVPYDLCDANYVGDKVNNPELTGVGVIQIRFAEEGCQESVEVCCTIPKSPTSSAGGRKQKTNVNKVKGCGYSNPAGIDFTIVGKTGSASQFGEFPWVVALMNILDDSYIGVGVLIHPQVVLTAAHIAFNYSGGGIKIRAGEWDTKTIKEPYEHQERDVREIYIHPEFNPKNLINDVAVLHLEKPVELAAHINTICLAGQNEVVDNIKNCVANGWGKDRFGKYGEFAVILKKLQVDMVEQSRCNTLLKRTRLGTRFILHSSFVCAGGEEGKDACTGDGGGPLACPIGNDRYKLAGLVAGGVGCGQKDVPGLYTSIPTLRSWVDGKMNMLGYGTTSYTI